CLCIPYTVSATTVQIKDEDEKIKQIELSDYLLLHQMDMFIDWKRINHLTEQISELITKPPENAILDKEGNIESGKTGLTLDKRAFEELIGDAVVNQVQQDRKSTRLNSSHVSISYAVFCLKKKRKKQTHNTKT